MKDLNDFTITELRAIEERYPTEPFSGIVIVPTNRKHESGYGCMKFVLTRGHNIVGCVGGCSDVVHLNGIGGCGENLLEGLLSGTTKVIDWSIDCLRKSRCLRVFCSKDLYLKDDVVLSDFVVYARDRK